MRHWFWIIAASVAATPALAADTPVLRPSRDVEVVYRTADAPQGPMPGVVAGPLGGKNLGSDGTMTIRYAARTGKLRIEAPNDRGYAIIDKEAGRMIMVMTQAQAFMEMPRQIGGGPDLMSQFEAANATFSKNGTDTVAGIACTLYDVSGRDGKARVCLTAEGVVLRVQGDDPDHRTRLEAIKITYAEQPAALFEPSPGYKKVDIPTIPGAMPPGLGSVPGDPRVITPGVPSPR